MPVTDTQTNTLGVCSLNRKFPLFRYHMDLPKIDSYGQYSSGNYGAHTLKVIMPWMDLVVYYSYETVVAFSHKGQRVVHENTWGRTTGKHLNWIDGGSKSSRVSAEEFERRWAEAMAGTTSARMASIKVTEVSGKTLGRGVENYARQISLISPGSDVSRTEDSELLSAGS